MQENQYQNNQQYNQYQQSQGNGQYYGQPQPPQNNGNMPLYGLWLALSIIMCFVCLLAGVVACIFVAQANKAYKNGDINGSNSKKRVMQIALIIGAVIFAIIFHFVGKITTSYTNNLTGKSQEKTVYQGTKLPSRTTETEAAGTDESEVQSVDVAEQPSSAVETTGVVDETVAASAVDTETDGVSICGYESADVVASGFSVKGDGNGHVCIYNIGNKTDTPVEVSGKIKFYDAGGNVVDMSDVMMDIPAKGYNFSYDYCDTAFTKAEITLDSETSDYIHPATLHTKVTNLSEDLVAVDITNTGSAACDAPYAMALFCDGDGNCVEVETGYSEAESIKPGETVSMTMPSYDYDTAPYKSCIVLAHANENN